MSWVGAWSSYVACGLRTAGKKRETGNHETLQMKKLTLNRSTILKSKSTVTYHCHDNEKSLVVLRSSIVSKQRLKTLFSEALNGE